MYSITRIAEVNATIGIDGDVVGLIVTLALVSIGKDGDLAVGLGPCDPTQHGLARQQAPFGIPEQAIGACILAEDRRVALGIEAVDMPASAGEHAEFRMPRRPLSGCRRLGQHGEFGIAIKDRLVGEGQGQEHERNKRGEHRHSPEVNVRGDSFPDSTTRGGSRITDCSRSRADEIPH
jgi:hypothetical protein